MDKNILVASYYFPPYPGIGGRRMAKFCKYLVQKGYTIHIIKVENPHAENSQWLKDIDHPNIKLYSLPLSYPKVLMMAPDYQKKKSTLAGRINYRFTRLYYSSIQKKRIYDLTFRWKEQFTALAESLIKKYSIKNFIVSVSPYYYAYYAALIKKRHPELNLIIDFRDPWLTVPDYGLQSMSPRQKKNEHRIISEVIASADYLISPSIFVLDEFKPFRKNWDHFMEIPHAYDWDDIKTHVNKIPDASEQSQKMKFIYPGTLYTDILPSLLKLNEVLNYLKVNHPAVYANLEFDFYVNEIGYKENFLEHSCVRFHKPIGEKIYEKVRTSTIVLILYADHNKNYRTTKFYEFLPFQKKYLFIGPKGDTYHFIEKYQLGNSFEDNVSVERMADYFLKMNEGGSVYLPLIDYNSFSFSKQTDRLIGLFK
jgi:hypothetical protein